MKLNLNQNIAFKRIYCEITKVDGSKYNFICPNNETMHISRDDNNFAFHLESQKSIYKASDILIKDIDNNSKLFFYDNTKIDKPLTVEKVSNQGYLIAKGKVEEKTTPSVNINTVNSGGSVKVLSANVNIDSILYSSNLVIKYGSDVRLNTNSGSIYINGTDGNKSPMLRVNNNFNCINVDTILPVAKKNISSVIINENNGYVSNSTGKNNIKIKHGNKKVNFIQAKPRKIGEQRVYA